MRAVSIEREVEPIIGFEVSLLLGAGATIGAVAAARLLPLLPEHSNTLLVPGAIATIATGFVLLVGRVKAIAQVCGYLILENGIYLPPSQFEAGFLSTAHNAEDIEKTVRAASKVMRSL